MANVFTPEFRVSWPKVFKPELNPNNNKEEYSVQALFKDGEDLKEVKAAVMKVAVEKWGADQSKWHPKVTENIKNLFKKQTETRTNKEGKAVPNAGHKNGNLFLYLKSTQRPGVVDSDVQPIIVESDFYSGCYAVASVRPYCYDVNGNKGVSLGLQNIQKTKDGDPLSGKPKAETEFAPLQMSDDSDATDLFA